MLWMEVVLNKLFNRGHGMSKTYLALGDSMSIDDYTGVEGGGAANQFFRMLGHDWSLDDRTFDGCQMEGVPRDGRGDLITLTIGGNDLLWHKEKFLRDGFDEFAAEHRSLLADIRGVNPAAIIIVGDIYQPAETLSKLEAEGLANANAAIRKNCAAARVCLAGIHETFQGKEEALLCLGIEPTLAGAQQIAELFRHVYLKTQQEKE